MVLLKSCILWVFVLKISSFNLDTNNVIIYLDPFEFNTPKLDKLSYFGYSVLLYGGNQIEVPWVQIGAPRGSSRSDKNTGVIFRCGIHNVCKLIDITEGKRKSKIYNKNTFKKEGAWFGGAMDISSNQTRTVVCGHRWVQISRSKYEDYWMQGACYWSHVNGTVFDELIPLQNRYKAIQQNAYYYGQGTAGISTHFTNAKEHVELLLGAPGVRNWAGTAILYQDDYDQEPVASRQIYEKSNLRQQRSINVEEFASVNIADAAQTNIFDLFGYSVSSGYFFNKQELLYVTSAPKSHKYFGQVILYKFANESEQALNIRDSVRGRQFGEYFGASLAVGDINADGYDDVIIGAPYYSSIKYNEGRIYVYFGNPKGSLEKPEQGFTVDGKEINGQFGACVSYITDIDRDGYSDVAVGAPNENGGSGVVYIFKGTSNGLNNLPSQRIIGKSIVENIKGFGMSISKPADIDNNNYNDIAVGAYLSGHVILFRGRPTVAIYHGLTSYTQHLNYTDKNLTARACYYYKGSSLEPSINIKRTINADPQLVRAYIEGGNTKDVILQQKQVQCENITIFLKENITNLLEPLVVTLTHEFQKDVINNSYIYVGKIINGTDYFCPRCAVYDEYRSSKKQMLEIPFTLGCGIDNICNTELVFEAELLNLRKESTFILGSTDLLTLKTSVSNQGEKAYLTQLIVELPMMINFKSIPANCIEQNSPHNITCNVDNPLFENKTKTINLDLDMKDINSGKYHNDVHIHLIILTSSNNKAINQKTLSIKLLREADITITGKSGQQSYSFENSSSENLEFTQLYQIEKFGASPIHKISIEITAPKYIKFSEGFIDLVDFYQPEGYLGEKPINCHSNISFGVGKDDKNVITQDSLLSSRILHKRSIRDDKENCDHQDFQLSENNTLYINCSNVKTGCITISCSTGPFMKRQNIAALQIKMALKSSVLKALTGKKNFIVLTTEGKIGIEDPQELIRSQSRPHVARVSSIFVGAITKFVIEWWIIIIAAVTGLLLLMLLIVGLIKAGFFKRTKKLELEALKTAEANEELIHRNGEQTDCDTKLEDFSFNTLTDINTNTLPS